MKTIIFVLSLFSIQKAAALTIASITLSAVADDTIRISINTEAVELYYFESWQYSVTDHSIVLEACFVPGFGSTIAYLNNNFEIPLDMMQSETYQLTVKAYYNYYEDDCLQDSCQGLFSTPLSSVVLSGHNIHDISNTCDIQFANPSDGKLLVNPKILEVYIFDTTGRIMGSIKNYSGVISLQYLADGFYFIGYFKHGRHKTIRVVLKKL